MRSCSDPGAAWNGQAYHPDMTKMNTDCLNSDATTGWEAADLLFRQEPDDEDEEDDDNNGREDEDSDVDDEDTDGDGYSE
jgi:hypothetical protein